MRLDDERYHYARLPRADFFLRRALRKPTIDSALYADAALTQEQRLHLEAVAASAQRRFEDRQLLFIYGVMPRSGTNFLYELLLRVPPFARSRIDFAEMPILAGEDYFRGATDLIGRVHPPSAEAFGRMEWMSYAVSGFRNRLLDLAEPGSVTLIKTPLVWNIELFPTLFPQDRMIFIVRDARYIVDSFMRTFARTPMSRTFEDVCMETRMAMDKSEAFLAQQPADRVMPLRYEEVVRDKGGALRKIFDWMGIEPGVIDGAIEHLPIYGSSTHSRGTGGAVDWKPVEADGSFDPTSRPLDWTEAQKRVFARTCGEANRRQGYPDR